MKFDRFKYDAFVSHAVEDKIAVANELCLRLEQAGLTLWYSGKELKLGDSLERSIDVALDQSRYGIVILSPTYLGKSWPRKEYYMLKAKEAECGKVILPVLYGITMEELQKSDIHIADRWAISVNDKGMDVVVDKILEVIHPVSSIGNQSTTWRAKATRFFKNKTAIGTIALASILSTSIAFYSYEEKHSPPLELVHQHIEQHLKEEDLEITQAHDALLTDLEAEPSTMADVSNVFRTFSSLKSNYRNEYEFRHRKKVVRSKKNIEKELKVDVESFTPKNTYKLISPNIFLATKFSGTTTLETRYLLLNTQPVTYRVIEENRLENGDYVVTVAYTNYIREFFVSLLFPAGDSDLKRHQMIMMGLLPIEKYFFHQENDGWILDRIE
jgi:hypothetical protein